MKRSVWGNRMATATIEKGSFSLMLKRMSKRSWRVMMVAAVLMIMGCSKPTTEQYDQLHVGMAYDEVVSLLGDADECSGAIGLKNCTWGDEAKHIKVSFAGDKVVVFSGQGL
jgi:hypothetical protein